MTLQIVSWAHVFWDFPLVYTVFDITVANT